VVVTQIGTGEAPVQPDSPFFAFLIKIVWPKSSNHELIHLRFFQQLKRGRIDSNEGISPRASQFNPHPGPGGGELTPQQHAFFHN